MKTFYIKSNAVIEENFDVTSNGEKSLSKLQKAVGGFIEYAPNEHENTEVIVNEEGLLQEQEANLIACGICNRIIVGNVVVRTSNIAVQHYIKKCSALLREHKKN